MALPAKNLAENKMKACSDNKGAGCRQQLAKTTGNNEASPGMSALDLINRGIALGKRIGSRTILEDTKARYIRVFVRMWRHDLDPFQEGIARDTYSQRKAALYAITSLWVGRLMKGCYEAMQRNDRRSARRWARILRRVLDRLEPAIERDPPPPPDVPLFELPASRWQKAQGKKPKRGEGSKRHLLPQLPRDWQQHVWGGTPDDYEYRAALALLIAIPLRSVELTPGFRGGIWSEGILLVSRSPRDLSITVARAKIRRAKRVRPWIIFEFDATEAGGPVKYLVDLCHRSGGRKVVTIRTVDAFRKAIANHCAGLLPEIKEEITPMVFRHQTIADYKKTFGAGPIVAAAAGHISDRFQAHYGYVVHGNRRNGILDVRPTTPPRTGNVARVEALSNKRNRIKRKP